MGWVQLGFLGASAAVAIPIVIHLVFGRRSRRVDLGTLRFLKIVLSENVRRRRLKRWLLLALRMACVALLACLFARPYLLGYQQKGNDRLVVVLLDRSASMGVRTQGGRLLDRAVAEAQKIVAGCSDGTELEVAYFDHTVHPLGSNSLGPDGPPNSTEVTRDLVADLTPPESVYSTTDYGAALAWARDICVQSGRLRKEIYLLTDLQRSGFDQMQPKPLPADVDVHLIDVGEPYPKNVAVTHAILPKSTLRPGEPLVLTASLLNAGQFAVAKVPVIVHLRNGDVQQNLRNEVDLDAGASAVVRFEISDLAEGLWQGYVMAETEDDLPFDDRRYLAFLVAQQLRVLLIDGDPGVSPLTAESYFLETALRLAPPGDSFADSPFLPTTVALKKGARLPNLKEADLIVLANVESVAAADVRRLAQFVEAGGGLIVFSGENVQANGYRSWARVGLSVGELLGAVEATTFPWRLDRWEEEHPALRPFRDPQYGDLRRLTFRCYTRIEPNEDTRVLARYQNGDPALLERSHGRGKVLWFNSACDRDWSDWPRSRLFVPLVHQMLGHLAGLAHGGPVRYAMIDETESSGDDPVPGVFEKDRYHQVINSNPRESETDRCTSEQFATQLGFQLQSDSEIETVGVQNEVATVGIQRPDEVWHWVLLVLFGLLLIENTLANRTPA